MRDEIKKAAGRRAIYLDALHSMREAFRALESLVPHPAATPCGNGYKFRYTEQSTEQALVLKLARQINSLHALDLLLLNGFVQEQCVLQRTLDDLAEDVLFLVLSITNGAVNSLHIEYLEYFWMEEFSDPDNPVATKLKRGTVKRSKIRAFVNRALGQPDPSSADAVGRSVHGTYSGYVHAAAPHVMELLDENTGRFRLEGMLGHPRYLDHVFDAQNYFYRGFMSAIAVAKALGSAEILGKLEKAMADYVRSIGQDELELHP